MIKDKSEARYDQGDRMARYDQGYPVTRYDQGDPVTRYIKVIKWQDMIKVIQ